MQITVNETGARTLKDARPMMINGQNVYVAVGAGTASLIIGTRIVAEKDAEGMNTTEAQAWAVSYRDGLTAVEEAVNPESVYAGAVAQVRSQAAELLVKAEAAEAHGVTPYRVRSSLDGRMRTFTADDPRHPVQAAKIYRADAEILILWTATDEIGYTDYVQGGLADTNGYYTSVSRTMWKRFLAA